jgi:hypothetical protein
LRKFDVRNRKLSVGYLSTLIPITLVFWKLLDPSFLLFGTDEPKFFGTILDLATAAFCIVLFIVSFAAWATRGRQRSLLIVSAAFLVFLVKQIIEFVPLDDVYLQFGRSLLDFLTLALFFVGLIMIGSRKRPSLKDLK